MRVFRDDAGVHHLIRMKRLFEIMSMCADEPRPYRDYEAVIDVGVPNCIPCVARTRWMR